MKSNDDEFIYSSMYVPRNFQSVEFEMEFLQNASLQRNSFHLTFTPHRRGGGNLELKVTALLRSGSGWRAIVWKTISMFIITSMAILWHSNLQRAALNNNTIIPQCMCGYVCMQIETQFYVSCYYSFVYIHTQINIRSAVRELRGRNCIRS